MVASAPGTDSAPVAPTRAVSPLERTRSLADPHEGTYVQYEVDATSEHRVWAAVYHNNRIRCAPWWFRLPIHPLMLECPKCLRFTPPPYFEGGFCADCRSNVNHTAAMEWRWFVSEHRYASWWEIGWKWYASRPFMFPDYYRILVHDDADDEEWDEAVEYASQTAIAAAELKALNAVLEETNLTETEEGLQAEIEYYLHTGTISKPRTKNVSVTPAEGPAMKCERCDAQRVSGTRYCAQCKKIVLAEMKERGYLQTVPRLGSTRTADQRENTWETKGGNGER